MNQPTYDTTISELKKLKQLMIKIYGKSHKTVKAIDRICSEQYGIDLYINEDKRLNLLVLGEVSSSFNHSFLKSFFPAGISEIFLKRCENGINKVVFNNVSTYDQIYIALEKEKMLSEEKRLYLENMFELLKLDIRLIPAAEENLYRIENNAGLLSFNDHMESILFGDFNERFSVFYENFLIEKIFVTRNFGSDSLKLSKPINKLLWIPNADVSYENNKGLEKMTEFIEDTLGFNYYTFVCGYTGEKFIPTIVEKNNQNLLQRIGEEKRSFINELMTSRCFFDDRIAFKKGKELTLDFLTEEIDGRCKFRKENAFDISKNDLSTLESFFNEDIEKLQHEAENYLKRDISELTLCAEDRQSEMTLSQESQKTRDVDILDLFEFLRSIFIFITDLFDKGADTGDILSDMKKYIAEFESEKNLVLFDKGNLDDLEGMIADEDLHWTPEAFLKLQKKVFKMFEDILLKCKIEIKSIQKQQKDEKAKTENSSIAVQLLFEHIKAFIVQN